MFETPHPGNPATSRSCSIFFAQKHLRGRGASRGGSAAATSVSHKCQHCARPGQATFDERSHKLATYAVECCWRLGVKGSTIIDHPAATVVGRKDGGFVPRKGFVLTIV